jgi:hypothetical protein
MGISSQEAMTRPHWLKRKPRCWREIRLRRNRPWTSGIKMGFQDATQTQHGGVFINENNAE